MSRYDLFRRRIAPIAFFLAIALIARDSCEKDKRTHTTVEIELGDARPRVRDVDVRIADTDIMFSRHALPDSVIAPCRFVVALPEEDGVLEIDVTLGSEHRHVVRRFHAVEGGTLLVPIGEDLQKPH